MTKKVPLDVLAATTALYQRMQKNHDFAFVNNHFEKARIHPILCRFGVFNKLFSHLLSSDNLSSADPLHTIYFQQISANLKVIFRDKEFAYPHDNIDLERAYVSINCISASLKNYHDSISLLGKHCLSNKTLDFDLMNFVNKISCLDYYSYAYPNEHYSDSRAHTTFQMLLTFTAGINDIICSINTSDSQLKPIIVSMNEKLVSMMDNLNIAYPNNNFNVHAGHTQLSNFLQSWKSFKETSLNSLHNYYDKKDLIINYEKQLKNKDQLPTNLEKEVITTPTVNDPPVNTNEVVENKSTSNKPVVKKFKSLL